MTETLDSNIKKQILKGCSVCEITQRCTEEIFPLFFKAYVLMVRAVFGNVQCGELYQHTTEARVFSNRKCKQAVFGCDVADVPFAFAERSW